MAPSGIRRYVINELLVVVVNFFLNSIYRMRLLMAAMISLLVFSVFAGLVSQALEGFFEHKKAIYKQMELSIDNLQFFLKDSINSFVVSWTATPLPDETELETFYISIDRKNLAELNSDLPMSGKARFYEAYLRVANNGEVWPVKLRYRGDNSFHWMYPQKSLRIKFKQNGLYEMHKAINLVNPPRMEGYVLDSVSYELARELGVISPDFYPVRVFINGENMGVYTFLSQADESLLRRYKRMPGSIYAGDGAKINEESMSELWYDQSYWKKDAARNAEQKEDRSDIVYYLKAANDFSNFEFHEFVNLMINKEKFYAYMALDVILGSSHHDYHHNHKLYFDPYLGKFEPIEWDVRYWTATPNKDESIYPIMEKMKLNPIVEYERDKVAYDLLTNAEFFSGIHRKIDKYNEMVRPDLMADPYRDNAEGFAEFGYFSKRFTISTYDKSVRRLHAILDNRKKLLMKVYQDSKSSYFSRSFNDGVNIIFKAEGNSPIKVNFSTFITDSNARIYRDVNFNGELDLLDDPIQLNSVEMIYSGRKKIDAKRIGDLKTVKGPFLIKNAPSYYSYLVVNADVQLGGPIEAENAVTGEPVTVPFEKLEIGEGNTSSIHPWGLLPPDPVERRLGGSINVKGDMVFEEFETVRIEPGTTFTMKPGASIYFYGKVLAMGSADRPIRFVAADREIPWGSVVLHGRATTGSRFDHVEFSGGSTTRRNLVSYTAQFNVHDTGDFLMTNSTVGVNHIGDDSMHIAYSEAVVDSSFFHGARSDALDVDISDVKVSNSVFVGSGNDALDLMTTEAKVENNVFMTAGDKGISTGEWSTLELSGNLFYRCLIGVEVKDKSVVRAENTIIVESVEKAVNLYNKNPRYDEGGTFISEEVIIPGNQVVSADEKSSLKIERIKREIPELTEYSFAAVLSGVKTQGSVNDIRAQLIELSKRYE